MKRTTRSVANVFTKAANFDRQTFIAIPKPPKEARFISGGQDVRSFMKGEPNLENDAPKKKPTMDTSSLDESVFNMFKNPDNNLVNIGQILTVIERTGVRRSDHRLSEMMSKLNLYHKKHGAENTTVDNLNVDLATFNQLVDENIVLINQTIQNKMIIPEWPVFCQMIKDIFVRCRSNHSGEVATYIPQLARYSKDLWAMSVCTVDGQRMALGDVDVSFTLQSCSKPFTYAICLNELGPEVVHKYIGHEPSGRNFNEICLDRDNKPHNPMLNSGAIMSCGLLLELMEPKSSLAEKYDFLLQSMQKLAGNESIGFNNAVFLSERETADRNFAMGYYMKENNCFPDQLDLHDCLDLYFQSCSLEVNTEALSVMGATLANGGICPTTGQKVLNSSDVRDVLSLMYSCGMYNYSGQFAFKVGLPAKSGVSGPILLVVPNVMCVALWSPPLDQIGNSVRGQQFCNELVDLFNFHRFDNMRHSEKKLDPRRESFEVKGLTVVTLLFAAVAGDVTALQRHYLQGMDMGLCDYDGRTALHLAAAEGHAKCVVFLLSVCQVDVEAADRWGHTPLQEAERGDHKEVARVIREAIIKKGRSLTEES